MGLVSSVSYESELFLFHPLSCASFGARYLVRPLDGSATLPTASIYIS